MSVSPALCCFQSHFLFIKGLSSIVIVCQCNDRYLRGSVINLRRTQEVTKDVYCSPSRWPAHGQIHALMHVRLSVTSTYHHYSPLLWWPVSTPNQSLRSRTTNPGVICEGMSQAFERCLEMILHLFEGLRTRDKIPLLPCVLDTTSLPWL